MLKKVLTGAVAMSVLMAGALPAFAEGDDEGPVKVYDEENHILMFAVEGECMLEAEVDIIFTVEEDGSISFLVDEEEGTSADSAFAPEAEVEGEDPLEGSVLGRRTERPGQPRHVRFEPHARS